MLFCLFAGEEAKKVFADAQNMLKSIINTGQLQCRGVVGFFRANQVGDDIEVYGENGEVLETLYGIRQQVGRQAKLWYQTTGGLSG